MATQAYSIEGEVNRFVRTCVLRTLDWLLRNNKLREIDSQEADAIINSIMQGGK